MKMQRVAWLVALVVAMAGCSMFRSIVGLPQSSGPSVNIKSAETRWLLIRNPRFGDVPSEPEYVWVEEDKVPTTLRTLLRGKGSIIAPPELVAQYGAPPGGGKISPRQGVPTQAAEPRASNGGAKAAATPSATRGIAAAVPALESAKRGLVVHVDTTRIVIDLAASDGLRPGSVVSLRRDKIPIVHPVTGEVLGELDEEVGTARVTEIRDKFSVAEIQTVAPGSNIQIRDRVVPK
jgi:hypothetical protein